MSAESKTTKTAITKANLGDGSIGFHYMLSIMHDQLSTSPFNIDERYAIALEMTKTQYTQITADDIATLVAMRIDAVHAKLQKSPDKKQHISSEEQGKLLAGV